ncbi:MAG: LicD family protein [Bacteroidota bacterium]|nr:LicD family protein [Bacteroidota bacterium]
MNNLDFYNEVINSEICPSNFSDIYRNFLNYQKIAFDTLVEFRNVCIKNGIKYQLAYGSLLGAIRDNGQIPWDYDVDVFVLYEDRDTLINALRNDLHKDFYFYCIEEDKKCRHFTLRVCPKGFDLLYFHVDVFFLIGSPENIEERRSYAKRVEEVSYMRMHKMMKIFPLMSYNPRFNFNIIKGKIKTLLITSDSLINEYRKLCGMYSVKASSFLVTADTFSTWYTFPKEILETNTININKIEFSIPSNYADVLNQIYGDYNKIPPLNKRLKELLYHYRRIEKYGKLNKNHNDIKI